MVNDILTDKKGFTWFTTYDGINRFDGTSCISNSQIGPGMEGISETRGLVEDKNGDIWIGSNEALILYSYTTKRFEKHTINPANFGFTQNRILRWVPLATYDDNLLISGGTGNLLIVYNTITLSSTQLVTP
ncbi:MAG: two-component regulator propeller domain-containing protein [Bacteroidota bacterium]|nr:two-component regulator propeller domain-containing protein [Bacteroidota bacterium]